MTKDPRFCLLLPLWRPFLEIPVCVYVYRSPIQVAQSLNKRDGFPITLGVALWEKYNLYGLANTADLPRILVSHEELMSNPIATIKKLHQDLLDCDVQGLRLPSEKELRAFIDPQFFHARGDTSLQNTHINRQQAILADAFEDGTIFHLTPLPPLSAGATEILKEYKNKLVAALETIWLRQEIGSRDQQISQRDQEVAQRNAELAQRHTELAHLGEELTKQTQALDQRNVEVVHLSEQLTQREAELTQRTTELRQRTEELVQANNELADLKVTFDIIKHAKEADSTRHKVQLTSLQQQLLMAESQSLMLKQEINDLINQQEQLQVQFNDLQNILVAKEQTLVAKEQTLVAKEHTISTLTAKTQRQEQALQKLLHWAYALDDDIQAVFNSLTWRAGNLFTKTALALMLKKPDLTARDHIDDIMGEVNALKSAMHSDTTPPPAPRQPLSVTVAKTKSPTKPLPKRQQLIVQPQHDSRDYPRWLQQYDTITKKTMVRMQQRLQQWHSPPVISIVMPTYNTEEQWLRAALDSVKHQIYPYWELCIADDASTAPHIRPLLEKYAKDDHRIKLTFRSENGHISAASNTALELVTGELVTFLDHDDLLTPHALFWVVQDLIDYPNTQLWYSDEDKINEGGQRHDPYFKSDWNPDLFLSHNLITHLAVYRTSLVQDLRGFREGFEGAQDYDLALRAIEQISPAQIRHIPRVLYSWRTITGSTASRPEEKPYAIIAAQHAISEHLARRNTKATVMESPDIRGTTRVQYHLPVHLPLVSLIIPTRNGLELLRRCVESIYDKTDYTNFEILIINNNSDDPATLDYLRQLEDQNQARLVDYPYPFNYADMNNMAVGHAQGDLIGLLNNDLEVISRHWLSELVSHALRPEVGVVGARLWYPNNTLQHGGVILGIGGVAGHSHKGLPRGDAGYFGRAGLIQNFSAVTGACMIMRKANFLLAGGLDAEHLATAFNDVDLCLKMNQHNLRVVWTPYAELYHHESASRGYEDTPEKLARFEKERQVMKDRWPNFILMDPAYSPNLTLETQDFAYAWPPRVSSV
jgi:glycosyltransferase involved in cell wall biosynthesis